MKESQREQQSIWAVKLGLTTNILLAILKTGVGITGHSPALLADGINSTSDVAYYVVVWVYLRLAGKPPDHEHPYGHRQLESIAALVVGSFVVTTAIAIFWNATNSIYDLWIGESSFGGATVVALWVAGGTIILKIVVATVTKRIGQKTNNAAVFALAYDHRNDIYAAIAATIGIALGRMGFLWVDPLAGALVALFILRTGIEILRESSDDLMDTIPGKSLTVRVTKLLQPLPGVHQVEEIHAHRFGPYLVVNVTIGVDGDISVAKGDAIACDVEQTLYAEMELLRKVYVHYHPVHDGIVDEAAQLICGPGGLHQHE